MKSVPVALNAYGVGCSGDESPRSGRQHAAQGGAKRNPGYAPKENPSPRSGRQQKTARAKSHPCHNLIHHIVFGREECHPWRDPGVGACEHGMCCRVHDVCCRPSGAGFMRVRVPRVPLRSTLGYMLTPASRVPETGRAGSQGSASLHPGLHADTRFAGSGNWTCGFPGCRFAPPWATRRHPPWADVELRKRRLGQWM